MAKKQNDISLVMIVKNEEKGLEKAILSCKDFVDQILISVDEASTDKTLEIAKKYADVVITHKWENDFSKVRNNLQRYVKTKWSLMLDGHEYVKQHPNLEEYLKSDVEGLFVKIELEDGFSFYYPRIYKSYLKYDLPVHNVIRCKTTKIYKDFIIIHDRKKLQSEEYIKQRAEQRKEMVLNTLHQKIEEDKKDYRSLFYLAQQYRLIGDIKNSSKYYKKYLKYSPAREERWLAYYYLGVNANMVNKPKRAIKFFKKAEKEIPNRWEIQKRLGTTYLILKKYKKALNYLVNSLGKDERVFLFYPEPKNIAQTWFFISQGFFGLKKYEEAKISLKRALDSQGDSDFERLPPEQVLIAKQILKTSSTLQEKNTEQIKKEEIIEVCLVVYQRYKRIPEILKQLKNQTIQNFRVNIWNNSGKKLNIKDFPKNRIKIINSKKNIGSKARFQLAKQTLGSPIIFIDDDEYLYPDFIEYYYNQYKKFRPKSILGYFTRTFNKESYWQSTPANYGEEVDYIATKSMILDREIIDKEPSLQNIPQPFDQVEDLYLCYLARMKYNIKLIKIEARSHGIVDGKDQWPKIDKEEIFKELRKIGWKLLKDKYANQPS